MLSDLVGEKVRIKESTKRSDAFKDFTQKDLKIRAIFFNRYNYVQPDILTAIVENKAGDLIDVAWHNLKVQKPEAVEADAGAAGAP